MLEKIIELTADTLGANAAEITAETSFMDDLCICKIRKDIDQELVKRRKRQGRRICAALL